MALLSERTQVNGTPVSFVLCSVIFLHARMLSYRAENIHERLEPQELYEREEMEEAVQIEVCRNSITQLEVSCAHPAFRHC